MNCELTMMHHLFLCETLMVCTAAAAAILTSILCSSNIDIDMSYHHHNIFWSFIFHLDKEFVSGCLWLSIQSLTTIQFVNNQTVSFALLLMSIALGHFPADWDHSWLKAQSKLLDSFYWNYADRQRFMWVPSNGWKVLIQMCVFVSEHLFLQQ